MRPSSSARSGLKKSFQSFHYSPASFSTISVTSSKLFVFACVAGNRAAIHAEPGGTSLPYNDPVEVYADEDEHVKSIAGATFGRPHV